MAAAAFLAGKGLAHSLGRNTRYPSARWLGRTAGRLLLEKRRVVQDNLRVLLGDHPELLEEKTNRLFENFALTLCDFMNPRDITHEIVGLENLTSLTSTKQGVLFVTFHLGHWDLGARILCEKGWKLTAIYQSYASQFLQRVIQANRPEPLRYVPVGRGAAFGAMAALERGEAVAVIGDKAFGEPGEPMPFLGGTVLWPKGPYVLAARTSAWVVPGVVVRVSPGHYKACVEKPIRVQKDSPAQATELARQVADVFRSYLQTYPEQWYRFERFWIDSGRSSVGRAHGSGP